MALEPSTKLVSILGFMPLVAARSASDSGVGVAVERVVLALAGADDLEVQVAGVVDQDLGLDRLVATADRVDRAGLLGQLGEVAADGDVGLDGQGGHVDPGGESLDRDVDATSGTPVASTTTSSGSRPRSSRPSRATLSPFSMATAAVSVSWADDGRDAGLAESLDGAVALHVEDGRQGDPRHPEQLGGEAAPHLPGADQADPQGSPGGVEPFLQSVAIAHWSCSLLGSAGRVMRKVSPTASRGMSPLRTHTSPGSLASVRPSALRSR